MAAPLGAKAGLIQFVAQGLMVVDFAVEDDDVAPAVGAHRLMTRYGQIQHRQAPVPQRHASGRVRPGPGIVRPPVPNSHRHLSDGLP
jgi:hypothetical protein